MSISGRSASIVLSVALMLGVGCGGRPGSGTLGGKQILGAVEVIRVGAAALDFAGRIDTGAEASAIHAVDLVLDGPAESAAGHPIQFTLENELGQRRRLTRIVADVVRVRTAGGSEARMRVPLRLSFRDVHKSVLVSLSDRGRMRYKLLVGRDWLGDDFLVDVARGAAD